MPVTTLCFHSLLFFSRFKTKNLEARLAVLCGIFKFVESMLSKLPKLGEIRVAATLTAMAE